LNGIFLVSKDFWKKDMLTNGIMSVGSKFDMPHFSTKLCFAVVSSTLNVPFKDLSSATCQIWDA
jgi:hypothetical protein